MNVQQPSDFKAEPSLQLQRPTVKAGSKQEAAQNKIQARYDKKIDKLSVEFDKAKKSHNIKMAAQEKKVKELNKEVTGLFKNTRTFIREVRAGKIKNQITKADSQFEREWKTKFESTRNEFQANMKHAGKAGRFWIGTGAFVAGASLGAFLTGAAAAAVKIAVFASLGAAIGATPAGWAVLGAAALMGLAVLAHGVYEAHKAGVPPSEMLKYAAGGFAAGVAGPLIATKIAAIAAAGKAGIAGAKTMGPAIGSFLKTYVVQSATNVTNIIWSGATALWAATAKLAGGDKTAKVLAHTSAAIITGGLWLVPAGLWYAGKMIKSLGVKHGT